MLHIIYFIHKYLYTYITIIFFFLFLLNKIIRIENIIHIFLKLNQRRLKTKILNYFIILVCKNNITYLEIESIYKKVNVKICQTYVL